MIGLPKTIDNDIFGTDVSFGFHSAVDIGTEAIDRLHSTALSHNRVMVIELMGHKAGWLALHAGVAGSGDVLLLPEIPCRSRRSAAPRTEGSDGQALFHRRRRRGRDKRGRGPAGQEGRKALRASMPYPSIGYRVAAEIVRAAGMETRVTVLGYLQRGGVPSPSDRVLSTAFGSAAAELVS